MYLKHHRQLQQLVESVIFEYSFSTRYLTEEEQQQVTTSSGATEPFSIQKFKSIQSFVGKVKYIKQYFQELGRGSARIAFLVNSTTVMKIARNEKGIAQNEVEIDASNIGYEHIAHIKDYDNENYTWLEVEKVSKFSTPKFKQLMGFSFKDFIAVLFNWYRDHENKRRFYLSPPNEEQIKESEIFYDISSMIGNHDLHIGDIRRPSSWGFVVRNGKELPVLADYGLTKDVYSKFYNKSLYEQNNIQQLKKFFNVEEFKKVPYSEKLQYLERNAKKIGEGSSRYVYDIGHGWALKFAVSKAGIAQNNEESIVCSADPQMDLFAKIRDIGPNYEWLIVQKAERMTSNTFESITGIDYMRFVGAILGIFDIDHGTEVQKKMAASLSNNQWFQKLIKVIKQCQYEPGDLIRLDSWGQVGNKAVIIDSGFTKAVHKKYYSGRSHT